MNNSIRQFQPFGRHFALNGTKFLNLLPQAPSSSNAQRNARNACACYASELP
jgi:hypothetical protein